MKNRWHTVAGKGGLGGSHAGPGCCGDKVVKGVVGDVPRNASSLHQSGHCGPWITLGGVEYLITDPDADVVFPLGKQHLNLGKLFRLAVRLHCCSHGVLEKLKEDVVEVGRGVD